jgi:DNA mismatch repair protein MutS
MASTEVDRWKLMTFQSILFDKPSDGVDERTEPSFFADLNLGRVVASLTAGRGGYKLEPFFYAPLHDVAAVRYRHEVLRDVQDQAVSAAVRTFAGRMRSMREHLEQTRKLRYRYQKESWFLDAVVIYCAAVRGLTADLAPLDLVSRGFRALRDYLTAYVGSDGFASVEAETRALKDALGEVTYSLHIRGARIRVDRYDGEADYSAEIERTFAKFQQGAVKDRRVKLPDEPEMNHVENTVLEFVARLYSEVFGRLDEFFARHADHLDRTIVAFDREIQFYLAYLEYMRRFTAAGLPFCLPTVSDQPDAVHAREAWDIALADSVERKSTIVYNDFSLDAPERILVVTGPNQGGKTTFARMFGQLHYLASLGLPVPAREAALFLPDAVFTHFEREEDVSTLRGKLEDELVRVHDILQRVTSDSVVIMNESFTSTTLADALFLGTEMMRRLVDIGPLCVYVTFVDELAALGESTVSMVATVVPEDPAVRTYKIVRKPADGLAYAAAIAQKYGLTYERLRRRIAS